MSTEDTQKWREANRAAYNAHMREHLREYRKKNREKLNEAARERSKKYRETHKAQLAAYQRAYYQRNREKLIAQDVARHRELRRRRSLEKFGPRPTTCGRCGAPITQAPYGRRLYCPECARIVTIERAKADRAARRAARVPVVVTRTCKVCGRTFEYTMKKGAKPVYCSDACRLAADAARPPRKTAPAPRTVAQQPRRTAPTPRKVAPAPRTSVADLRRQVEADMLLPAAARYEASKRWTPAQRQYAKQLWDEKNKGNWQ